MSRKRGRAICRRGGSLVEGGEAMSKLGVRLAAAAVLAGWFVHAHASLSLRPPQNFPAALGAENTILTLQNIGSFSFEAGSVGRVVGSATDVISGDVLTGPSQTRTRSLGSLGIGSAADLRVVFKPLEPADVLNQGISLNNLQLSIYSPTGSLLFNSGFFEPIDFADAMTGAGNSGFVFALDPVQAAQAQTFAFGSGFAANLVGLSAAASNATGSFETFYVASAVAIAPIPEPESVALLLVGFAAMRLVLPRRARERT
jgi:hypothetical protein